MSSVHYRFRSSIEFEPLYFDGHFISLKDLRESIMSLKKMGKAKDYTLEIFNSTTNKEYINDNEMIPKNTSLIIRRVPLHEKTIESAVLERRCNEISEISDLSKVNATEKEKIHAMMAQTGALMQDNIDMNQNSNKIPTCFHCKQNGHVIRNCPLLPKKSVSNKEPVHVYLKNVLGISKETPPSIDDENKKEETIVIPDHLKCPICKNVFQEASLVTCCGSSFCDKCIQNYLVDHNLICPSCHKRCIPEDLVPNISLRESIEMMLNHRGSSRTSTTKRSPTQASINKIKENGTKIENNIETTNKNVLEQTSIPNTPIVSNCLFSQIPVTNLPVAAASLFKNAILNSLNLNMNNLIDNHNKLTNLIKISAPFITADYAYKVITGERILTRDEFFSLKSLLSKNSKRNSVSRSRSPSPKRYRRRSRSRSPPYRRYYRHRDRSYSRSPSRRYYRRLDRDSLSTKSKISKSSHKSSTKDNITTTHSKHPRIQPPRDEEVKNYSSDEEYSRKRTSAHKSSPIRSRHDRNTSSPGRNR